MYQGIREQSILDLWKALEDYLNTYLAYIEDLNIVLLNQRQQRRYWGKPSRRQKCI